MNMFSVNISANSTEFSLGSLNCRQKVYSILPFMADFHVRQGM